MFNDCIVQLYCNPFTEAIKLYNIQSASKYILVQLLPVKWPFTKLAAEVLLVMEIIPIPWKVPQPSRVHTLSSILSANHCVKPSGKKEGGQWLSVIITLHCTLLILTNFVIRDTKSQSTHFINHHPGSSTMIQWECNTQQKWGNNWFQSLCLH